MIVLLEGADGTGKTTLGKQLCTEFDMEYVHFGIPDEHPMDYWFRVLSNVTYPIVIDRLHLSEEVYGSTYRDGSQLTELQSWCIEGWLEARNTTLVMCFASWDDMQKNQEVSVGPYHGEKQKEVVKRFASQISTMTLPLIIYDYTMETTGNRVRRTLDVRKYAAQTTDWNTRGLGSTTPNVWLVGEQPNIRDQSVRHLDQFPFLSSSGNYLRKAMCSGLFSWSTTHVSNATHRGGMNVDLSEQWERLRKPKVVALGAVANRQLTKYDVPHATVPHPQWWRRFRYSDAEGYTDELRKAAGKRPYEQPVCSLDFAGDGSR